MCQACARWFAATDEISWSRYHFEPASGPHFPHDACRSCSRLATFSETRPHETLVRFRGALQTLAFSVCVFWFTSQKSQDGCGENSPSLDELIWHKVFCHFSMGCIQNLQGQLFPCSQCSCSGTPSFSFICDIPFLLHLFLHFDMVGDIVTSANGLLVLPLLSPVHDCQIPSCG